MTEARWRLIAEDGEAEVVADCSDIEQTPVVGGTTLLGCRPGPVLRLALDALARGAGNPGGALHRRRINAVIHSVADNGSVTRLIDGHLLGSVTSMRPSALGADLLDVTLDAEVGEGISSGARRVHELWRGGRPVAAGLWVPLDSGLRHQWSGIALAHHRPGGPDRAAGVTYDLAGRHVTDVEGFYCALGEAVNGPGGYFGWNGAALHDCLRGGWGAEAPFRLVWHDAVVVRDRWGDGAFDRVLRWLAEDLVEVELR